MPEMKPEIITLWANAMSGAFACCAMHLLSHSLQNVLGPELRCAHAMLCRSARHENINRRLQQSAELLSSAHLRAQKQEHKLKSRKAPSARVYVM